MKILKNVEFLIEDLKNAIQNNQTSTLERINSLNEDLNSARSNANEKADGLYDRVNNLDNSLVEKFGVVNGLVNEKFSNVSDLVNEKFNHQYNVLDEIPKRVQEQLSGTTGDLSSKIDSLRDMICEDIKNSISSKIDTNSINTSEKLINIISDASNESSQRFEVMMNQASERIASTIIDNVKNNLVNIETYLENLQKEEGEAGRRKIQQLTRQFTVILAFFQSFVFVTILSKLPGSIMHSVNPFMFFIGSMIALTAGAVMVMWLAELITEKGNRKRWFFINLCGYYIRDSFVCAKNCNPCFSRPKAAIRYYGAIIDIC